MEYTRRRLLAAGSLASLASVAGCLDDFDPDDGPTSEEPNGGGGDENGSEGGPDGDETTNPGDDEEALPDGVDNYWVLTYPGGGETETTADVFSDAEDAERTLDLEALSDDARSDVEEFVERTSFGAERLVWLRTHGPNGCYELEFDPIEFDDEGGLRVSVTAVDGSAEDEVCAEAVTNLNALVRIRFEDEPPTEGSISITDGQGAEHGFGFASDSESASDEESDGERQ